MPFGFGLGLTRGSSAAGSPFAGAALDISFLGSTLDSRVTFSRTSAATYVGSDGYIAYAPMNLLTYSEQFDNAVWVVYGGTSKTGTNVAVAPDGTMTADSVRLVTPAVAQLYQLVNFAANTTYTISMYVMRNASSNQTFRLKGQNATSSDLFSSDFTATNTWQRFSYTFTTSGTAFTGSTSIAIDSSSNTADLLIWGAQLVQGSSALTYSATTSAVYYGPRFEYNPTTLAPKGLLIEQSSTNSLTYSQDFTNAAWNKSTCTVTPNVVTAPDGTLTGAELASTGSGSRITQGNIVVNATSCTFSAFVKVDGATDYGITLLAYNSTKSVTIGQTNALITSGTPYANGWYRHSYTFTTGANFASGDSVTFYLYTDSSNGSVAGSKLYAWGLQAEAGISFPTSYIPTTSATVTRAADVASMTGTNFSSWFNGTTGTFYGEGDVITSTPNAYSFMLEGIAGGGVGTISMGTGTNGTTNFGMNARIGGASNNSNESIAYTYSTSTVIKAAISYDGTPSAGLVLAGNVITANAVSAASTATSLSIGSRNAGSANLWNGHVRRIVFFNTKKTNAQMQTMTT